MWLFTQITKMPFVLALAFFPLSCKVSLADPPSESLAPRFGVPVCLPAYGNTSDPKTIQADQDPNKATGAYVGSRYPWVNRFLYGPGESAGDDSKDKTNGKDKAKNGDEKDKAKNGDDKDKDKMEEMRRILQLLADGKMTVEEAQGKLAEKPEDKKEQEKCKILPEGWNFHAQTTAVPEFQPQFPALYSGANSLNSHGQIQGTTTADLFLGVPLWHGAEFHADLLMWQGFGLSNTFGIEVDPNGDAYKAGTQIPRFMFSRFFVRQHIGLGGEQEEVPDGQLTLPSKQDVSRLTITFGRMSMADIFDRNAYNHDPHTQFFGFSGINPAWDYPSDTVGYTTGIAFELNQPDWAVRYGWYQMPVIPNGFTSDDRIFMWPIVQPDDGHTSDGEFWKEWGMILELERRWRIGVYPGTIRLEAWLEYGHWARYDQATALLLASPTGPNIPQGVETNIPAAAFAYHYKYGFGVNWEQEIAKNVGIFGRFGWQDGQTAAATYTDVDLFVQLGLSVNGAAWRRPGDTFGLCGNLAGASRALQAFLRAGGLGISAGDGFLTYRPELNLDTYYDFAISKCLHFGLNYQFYANPAFNRDRGPVNVFLARLHWEY